MKYLIVLLFIIIYFLFSLELGYSKESPLWTHVTYMFQHAGIIHLLINSFSFITICIALQRFSPRRTVFIWVALCCAVLCSFIPSTVFDMPTVGSSGVIFSLCGMLYAFNAKNVKMMTAVFFALVVPFFIKNVNAWLHLYCFCGGFIFGCAVMIYRIWKARLSP